jgi:hypothetical protein
MNQDEYEAERAVPAMREVWDRQFVQAKGDERLIELLRLALRVERMMHDLTRRMLSAHRILQRARRRSSAAWSLSLDHHGIDHPPLPEEMTVVTPMIGWARHCSMCAIGCGGVRNTPPIGGARTTITYALEVDRALSTS